MSEALDIVRTRALAQECFERWGLRDQAQTMIPKITELLLQACAELERLRGELFDARCLGASPLRIEVPDVPG